MQGGHPDGLRLRFGRIDRAGSSDSDSQLSGAESEMSVEDTVSLGRRLDGVVAAARTAFGEFLALPVAWIQLQPTVEALRKHKLKRVETGIEYILWIQTFRSKQFDILMQIFSFCAEEEFYLILLPLLFWNGYYELGRRLTFVVVTGLFVGNIIKDVFELPRPSCPPVWRPSNQEHLDSTALQDFGFPSTHAMNAVSNSILVAWYFWSPELEWHTPRNLGLIIFVIIWIALLSLSRMYLGAHTGTDVRGGLGLGALVIGLYIHYHGVIDSALASSTPLGIFGAVFAFGTLALLLCPQPRPPTPTFNQNALLLGLFWGLVFGARVADDFQFSSPAGFGLGKNGLGEFSDFANFGIAVARTIVGFVVTILMRLVVKTIAVALVELCGIQTKPKEDVVRRRMRAKGSKKYVTKVYTRIFTRDVDIIAVAFVKVMTYLATASTITIVFPFLFDALSKQALPLLVK